MTRERSREERFVENAAALRERFASGLLAELQPLKQWVVWNGELEEGKRKKVPYNPNYYRIHRGQASKFPKAGQRLINPYKHCKAAIFQG